MPHMTQRARGGINNHRRVGVVWPGSKRVGPVRLRSSGRESHNHFQTRPFYSVFWNLLDLYLAFPYNIEHPDSNSA